MQDALSDRPWTDPSVNVDMRIGAIPIRSGVRARGLNTGRRDQQRCFDCEIGTFCRDMRHQEATKAVRGQNAAERGLDDSDQAFSPFADLAFSDRLDEHAVRQQTIARSEFDNDAVRSR